MNHDDIERRFAQLELRIAQVDAQLAVTRRAVARLEATACRPAAVTETVSVTSALTPWAKSPDGTRWTAFLPDGRMAVVERLGDGESFLPRISAFGKSDEEATGPVFGGLLAAAQWCAQYAGAAK